MKGLYRKATPEELARVNTGSAVNTSVCTGVNTKRRSDRHKPGYMAEYMRKRRAKK